AGARTRAAARVAPARRRAARAARGGGGPAAAAVAPGARGGGPPSPAGAGGCPHPTGQRGDGCPGAAGRDLLEALIAGETAPAKLADRARPRRREQIPALPLALPGRLTAPHRFRRRMHLDPVTHRGEWRGRRSTRMAEALAPFAQAVERLVTIPGVSQRVAATVVAASGANRDQFPSAGPLASGAGLCPGNNARAGKRRRGRPPKGDRWRQRILVRAAWAARPPKGT